MDELVSATCKRSNRAMSFKIAREMRANQNVPGFASFARLTIMFQRQIVKIRDR